jgi:hypothetical protein
MLNIQVAVEAVVAPATVLVAAVVKKQQHLVLRSHSHAL